MSETWIVYKADSMSDQGWEDRQLMPGGGLTDILEENWDWGNHPLPEIGSRTRDYTNLADPGNGVTHGKDGDWVVNRIQQFLDPDSGDRVVICYCDYQPITPQWQELRRGAPVDEMLAALAK
jgi:hypothetical protein